MGLEEIIREAERSLECDQHRREVFQEEFEAYKNCESMEFNRTWKSIDEQRESINSLEGLLSKEQAEIEELIDQSDFLSVDQAVRNRDEAIEKLTSHNKALKTYVESVQSALDKIEENLTTIEEQGFESVENDPSPDFQQAREALKNHNTAVDGLGKNLQILNAYLL